MSAATGIVLILCSLISNLVGVDKNIEKGKLVVVRITRIDAKAPIHMMQRFGRKYILILDMTDSEYGDIVGSYLPNMTCH
jgi:hypothetical protein